ncbi:MAG: hypothetical protein LBL58_09425 [Tannerellaceae bacterium]|jgi:hypothetical protein|nr:hypothetical protein [Tannerellaceae bacterium]
MKRSLIFKTMLLMATTILLPGGCQPETDGDIPALTASSIIVKTSGKEAATSIDPLDTAVIVFTGNDILWFNETTEELRFKENFMNAPSNNPIVYTTQAIDFYMDDEYLFSSMTYVSVSASAPQIFNSLVFYYNATENKYYLMDGYPAASVLSNLEATQEIRNENRQKIAPEWNSFIEQMKKEGRYKN